MGRAARISRRPPGAPDPILALPAWGMGAAGYRLDGLWPGDNTATTLRSEARGMARSAGAAADLAVHAGLCVELHGARYLRLLHPDIRTPGDPREPGGHGAAGR